MDAYQESSTKILARLQTSKKGLSAKEAEKRLNKHGINELTQEKKISKLKILISQFTNILVIILIAATLISVITGEIIEAAIILVILVINGLFGFYQEYKAENAIEALKKMSTTKTRVLRDGKVQEMDARFLVPGDIILIEAGMKVPADARLLESSELEVQEAALTGESVPVAKNVSTLKANLAIGDQKNMIFSGTLTTKGKATAVVSATAMQTEIGKIAQTVSQTQDVKTPFQLKLEALSKQLGIIVLLICIVVFIVRIIEHQTFDEAFLLTAFEDSIALAVAAIPEGMPIIFTLSLAIGVLVLAKRNVLVRKLSSVETLGSTTVICSDKTGTLTKNEMTVTHLYVDNTKLEVTGIGYEKKGAILNGKKTYKSKTLEKLLFNGLWNNNALLNEEKGEFIGDPTEIALKISAAKYASLSKKTPKRLKEIEFTSERKMMSSIMQQGKQKVMYTKGAVDVMLKKCTMIEVKGKRKKMSAAERKRILKKNEEFSKQALRVLAFAYKPAKSLRMKEEGLVFVGLQAMIDPAREEVKPAIEECKQAGIRVIMITGDHKITAQAIAKTLGIEGEVVDGEELRKMTDAQLSKRIKNIGIFARVNPLDKVRIVDSLKSQEHVVAMTGDGINDAPALKKADLGISVGSGTDVAKEASDMILTDDNFTSIVHAIEEGRQVDNSVRKFMTYILSSNIGEVLTIFFAVLLHLPVPLVALQILWLNLLTDGLPGISLSFDPKDKSLMKEPPADAKTKILNKEMLTQISLFGLTMGIGTVAIFYMMLPKGYDYAVTVAFTTLVGFEIVNVYNSRTRRSMLLTNPINNAYLNWSIFISVVLQLLVIYSPLGPLFHVVPLQMMDWVYIILCSCSLIVVGELYKIIKSARLRWQTS